MDYLSEITMSLLTAAKQKNPVKFIFTHQCLLNVLQEFGYTPDFVHYVMAPLLAEIKQNS